MHRFKPLISLVPCNLRLWPFKENMFLIDNQHSNEKKQQQMLTNTKHITET